MDSALKAESRQIEYDNCMRSAKYYFISDVFCRICGRNIVSTILLLSRGVIFTHLENVLNSSSKNQQREHSFTVPESVNS